MKRYKYEIYFRPFGQVEFICTDAEPDGCEAYDEYTADEEEILNYWIERWRDEGTLESGEYYCECLDKETQKPVGKRFYWVEDG